MNILDSGNMKTAAGLSCLLLVLLHVLLQPAGAANRPRDPVHDIDRVLVVVNDDVITQTELTARVTDARKQLELGKIALPPDAVLRRQVLERMVLERIQLQLAEQTGIEVSNEKVDNAVNVIAKRNNMSVKKFLKKLTRQGIEPDSFRRQVRNQLIIQQLVDRDINNRISVSDSEVENFLESRHRRENADTAYNISHIMIPLSEGASSKKILEAKRKADEVRTKLRDGVSFEQAAVTYSQGQHALQGGNIGWKEAGQLPDLFLDALARMDPGDISEVLRSPNGFHILKLNDKRGATRKRTVTQTRVRHILLKPSEIQTIEEAIAKLEILKNRIENGEDFVALAKAFSEDPATAIAGGDLGWINPGQTHPDFEQVMDVLKPGMLSRPVLTPLGVHLIQVLERRQQDIGEELDRAGARQQIHARKADERYEQWVRRLLDEAYVEYIGDDEY